MRNAKSVATVIAVLVLGCSSSHGSEDAGDVGTMCVPAAVPPGGFQSTDTYVEAAGGTCGAEHCIVRGLSGDPRRVGCAEAECVTEAELRASVYCTCRCSAPFGGPTCACPEGFACVDDVVPAGEMAGGYCLRLTDGGT